MNPSHAIRLLVEKALYFKRLTPEIEAAINRELTRLGYISDIDYEALELLMDEMDAGRIQLVPRSSFLNQDPLLGSLPAR